MNDDDCRRYVADPEASPAHLETCERCRAMFGDDLVARTMPLPPLALPVAPWEGASYRSWALVAGAGLGVFAVACTLFAVAGISPLGGMAAAIGRAFPSLEIIQTVVFRMSGALRQVPGPWQVGIAIAFVVVNALLVLLLRRSTKGLDV